MNAYSVPPLSGIDVSACLPTFNSPPIKHVLPSSSPNLVFWATLRALAMIFPRAWVMYLPGCHSSSAGAAVGSAVRARRAAPVRQRRAVGVGTRVPQEEGVEKAATPKGSPNGLLHLPGPYQLAPRLG